MERAFYIGIELLGAHRKRENGAKSKPLLLATEESQNSKGENIPREDIRTGIEEVENKSFEPEQVEETGECN